jgi:hypothetical protein
MPIMGKYEHVFNSEKTSRKRLYPKEAVVAIAVITTLFDSAMSDVDIYHLVDQLWKTELFDDYSGDELLTMVEKFLDIAEDEGSGVLFNAAYASLSNDLVPDAFAIAVTMLVDDSGVIPTQKKGFLQQLQQALELEEREAQQIVDDVIADFKAAAG